MWVKEVTTASTAALSACVPMTNCIEGVDATTSGFSLYGTRPLSYHQRYADYADFRLALQRLRQHPLPLHRPTLHTSMRPYSD